MSQIKWRQELSARQVYEAAALLSFEQGRSPHRASRQRAREPNCLRSPAIPGGLGQIALHTCRNRFEYTVQPRREQRRSLSSYFAGYNKIVTDSLSNC